MLLMEDGGCKNVFHAESTFVFFFTGGKEPIGTLFLFYQPQISCALLSLHLMQY